MRARPLAALLTLPALVAVALAAGPAVPASDDPHRSGGHHSDDFLRDLAVAKKATARFRDEKKAIAAGYKHTDICIKSDEGAMGYHYVKDAYIGSVDPAKPAMLVYLPAKDKHAKRKLGAVEWVVWDRDDNVNTDEDRPRILGRGLDGPMPGHNPAMPVHYDLHAWIWHKNPNGMTAMWHPKVHCPKPKAKPTKPGSTGHH
ncbi:hypothetical protein [Streptomyces sp. XD-27]|uniref:hypothetical protein n=1 Tax=Streptomyces sp. XD-27 TaxID=3062779 RepID=UPI0026F431A1|nr:hypothetical protein [Streptomyces sp. XD-27]WKX69563.1 hypothetical protein Q3Y56_06235 [Streptomyces sp. XD-27]